MKILQFIPQALNIRFSSSSRVVEETEAQKQARLARIQDLQSATIAVSVNGVTYQR
jgi:hypothetical protein